MIGSLSKIIDSERFGVKRLAVSLKNLRQANYLTQTLKSVKLNFPSFLGIQFKNRSLYFGGDYISWCAQAERPEPQCTLPQLYQKKS